MATTTSSPVKPRTRGWLGKLGPGLVTGASDDDPSGIATYSQAGAQFGYSLGWTLLLSFPLMVAIQEACARLGRISGKGLATNIAENFPRPVGFTVALLLLAANVINLGADLGAMAAALQLLVGGPREPYVIGFGLLCAGLITFIPYERYSAYLKWLCLSLLAYVGTVFAVHVPWAEVARQLVWPSLQANTDYITAAVAIFGTTISPYLFFWQASQEAERQAESPRMRPLTEAPRQAPAELRRISIDTWLGMGLSNLIGLFIIVTTAATLHASGKLDIQTSADAASALRPIAGDFAFAIFAAGIIGTGMLGVPVLAGAAAFGVCGTLDQPAGLGLPAHGGESLLRHHLRSDCHRHRSQHGRDRSDQSPVLERCHQRPRRRTDYAADHDHERPDGGRRRVPIAAPAGPARLDHDDLHGADRRGHGLELVRVSASAPCAWSVAAP